MTSDEALKHTPLHALHMELRARMVPFAGYDMPVQYPPGVLKEHLHTRAGAGLFDVSHMGQIVIRAKSGDVRDAARALERLVPVDILDLAPGRLRYAFFTNAHGGILDDLMVANCGDHLLLVVNAACKATDEALLRGQLGKECKVERLDRALIALQGPKAETALAILAPECTSMRFMDVRTLTLMGAECMVSRSGYTGEDGYGDLGLLPTSLARSQRNCSQMQTLHRSDLARGIRFAWKPDFAFTAQISMIRQRRLKQDCRGLSRRSAAPAAHVRAGFRVPRSSSGNLNTGRLAIASACGPRDGRPCAPARPFT